MDLAAELQNIYDSSDAKIGGVFGTLMQRLRGAFRGLPEVWRHGPTCCIAQANIKDSAGDGELDLVSLCLEFSAVWVCAPLMSATTGPAARKSESDLPQYCCNCRSRRLLPSGQGRTRLDYSWSRSVAHRSEGKLRFRNKRMEHL